MYDDENYRENIANKLNKDPTIIRSYIKPMFEKGIIYKNINVIKKMIEIIFDLIIWKIENININQEA